MCRPSSAFYIYKNTSNSDKPTKIQYNSFVKKYTEDYIIDASLIAKIENPDYPIICFKNGKVQFAHDYIYYYFVGKYLSDNTSENVIESLCNTVYKKDASNILIFTIHHISNNPNTVLLDTIQAHCMVAFDNIKPARLTIEETAFLTTLIKEIPIKIGHNNSVNDNIKQQRLNAQAAEEDTPISQFEEEIMSTEIINISKAIKIMEVLGQIIKNRSGSFEKTKVKDLTLEVENLGLRILNFFLTSFKSNDFYDWVNLRLAALEKEKYGESSSMPEGERRKYAEKNIQLISLFTIYGMLDKIYNSIATSNLSGLQNEITEMENSPAFDMLNILHNFQYKKISYDFISKYNKKFDDNLWAKNTITHSSKLSKYASH